MVPVARQLHPTHDPAAPVRCMLVERLGSRKVGARLVRLAHHREPVPVDVSPGLEEPEEPEPQALPGLVPDGVRGEEVDVAEEDHAVPWWCKVPPECYVGGREKERGKGVSSGGGDGGGADKLQFWGLGVGRLILNGEVPIGVIGGWLHEGEDVLLCLVFGRTSHMAAHSEAVRGRGGGGREDTNSRLSRTH